jgi:hypothetical protein
MVGNVPAAVRLVVFNAGPLQDGRRRQHVLQVAVAAHGDHVRMLNQKQPVRRRTLFAFRHQLALELKGLGITHPAQVHYFQFTH